MADDVYFYSVVTAYPRPWRAECLNVGLILLAADGSYSDVKFGNSRRLVTLDPDIDLHAVQASLRGLRDELPLHGRQTHWNGGRSISLEQLQEWSARFGGMVRISPPRAVLAANPITVLHNLFDDHIGGGEHDGSPHSTRTRRKLLTKLDQSFKGWQMELASIRVEASTSVRGFRAEHAVDRAYFDGSQRVVAVLDALDFSAGVRSTIYSRRATLAIAAEDIHQRNDTTPVSIFALLNESPDEDVQLREETVDLLQDRGVKPVTTETLTEIKSALDAVVLVSARA